MPLAYALPASMKSGRIAIINPAHSIPVAMAAKKKLEEDWNGYLRISRREDKMKELSLREGMIQPQCGVMWLVRADKSHLSC